MWSAKILIVILSLFFITHSETIVAAGFSLRDIAQPEGCGYLQHKHRHKAEEFISTTIPTGMRVLILERPQTDTVTINFYIGIGRINEPQSGAANLLLHMLFRGNDKYPAREIPKEVSKIGGTLDYHVGYLSSVISISLPSNPPCIPSLEKGGDGGFDRAIALFADIILNPILDTDELDKERTLILQKLAISKDFPINRFFKEVMLRQFPDHPFGRSSEGTEDSVKKLNA
ncbi:MAG: insulinase family protein, partial [Planctomycetes bacterium]|nr:insulinase family protein [Planctomycetota bacterium]